MTAERKAELRHTIGQSSPESIVGQLMRELMDALDEAQAALEPFAKWGEQITRTGDGCLINSPNLGDLRRAADVLRK